MNLQKIEEGLYRATSKPCPMCNQTMSVEITGDKVFHYHQGALLQDVLPDLTLDERERFISGYCATCWVEMFGDDDEDDDEY